MVNSTTNEKEWVVRAGEFDVDRGDLGRLVGMVAGAKRRLGPERPTDKAPPESTGSGLASTGSPLSVGVPEITEMLRSALQSGTGTHLDVGTGYVRWQGDPEQGIFAEASNGRPGEEPIDNGLADALVSVGWSRPRPKEGIEVCWVELMLGADEPSHRFDARLEAVAEVILNGMTALLERD